MRRRLVPFVALVALALPATAQAAEGGFFAGDTIDGPSSDIERLGDLDVARDGGGALAYVKRVDGVPHIFVSRLIGGVWQAPEQVDAALSGAGSQPVVSVSDGGRLVVAFVSGGAVYTTMRTTGDAAFTAPTLVAASGRNPALDMSINGVAYLAFVSPGVSAADVRVARLERHGQAFTVLPDVVDVTPAADAGLDANRPSIAVAADGIATVVWGEAGHVYGRRIFEMRLSTSPQDLNLPDIGGQLGGNADRPDIGAEDDSSFAWVVFRQAIGGIPRAIARRLVGSQFEAPTIIDGGEAANVPRIAINGRGVGYAAVDGASGVAYGAVLKDDIINGGVALGGGAVASLPAPAADETGDGLIAFQASDRTIHARGYDYVPASRAVTTAGPDVLLSRPEWGPSDAARGLLAAANRVGDVAVAYVQGEGSGSRIVAAAFDRLPGVLRSSATRGWWTARPTLRWSAALESWGPLTYEVQVDGTANGQTQATRLTLPNAIPDGLHRWRVVAIDRRGQRRASSTRTLLVDGTKPRVAIRISGQRRRGTVLQVTIAARDLPRRAGTRASGLQTLRTSFGDGSRALRGKHARHRYRTPGTRTIRVTVTDRAGNATVIARRVTIR